MPTIFDVAAAAGVSHQTVSRVLKGDPTVRPAVRERVDSAVQQLEYRPNAAARALASRRTRILGLLVVDLPLYGPSSITRSFNAAARRAGHDVSIAALERADAADVLHAADTLLAQDVRALVVVASSATVGAVLAPLTTRVPVITTVHDVIPDAHSVGIDNAEGALLAVRHLAALRCPPLSPATTPASSFLPWPVRGRPSSPFRAVPTASP